MYQYLWNYNTSANRTDAIRRVSDGATIPNDPMNMDWQKYQVWLGQGNTPDAA